VIEIFAVHVPDQVVIKQTFEHHKGKRRDAYHDDLDLSQCHGVGRAVPVPHEAL
jgi:hypothetical protein